MLCDCKRVILFGGSFDPPHMAHVALPLMAMRAVDAQAVAFIPAGRAPHKRGGEQTAAHHRLAMLRLAIEDVPAAVVLTDEIDRAADGRPSFTVDTLTVLRGRLGAGVEMRLLIGADMLRIFSSWREPGRVVELAQPLVMVRPPETRESLLEGLASDEERRAWGPRLLDLPRLDVSSSGVRAMVARGESIAGLVSPRVEDYIRREGLYRQE